MSSEKVSIQGLNEYQSHALETATYSRNYQVIYPALGLNGEAGEVAEKVKKVIRDNDGILDDERKLAIAKECGDCLWYVAVLAHDIGFTLQEIAEMNYEKLCSRVARGVLKGSGDER